ncbi:MAG: FecR domain-containing protein [Rhodoplanes sp.]|nr:FecR domain-containing protein [Rhodoplanes sp.]
MQKIASGGATPEELEAARRWRAENVRHAKAYDDAERVWNRMGAIGRARHGPGADFVGPLREFGRRRAAMNRRALLAGGIAAIGAGAGYGLVKPPLGLWPSLPELQADYRTGTGEQRTIRFADAVAIELNTQTSLAIRPVTVAQDCVELISGEASFAIPVGAARPLVVFAANGKTLSDSGRFDVRYIPSRDRLSASVTCFEGRLRTEFRNEIAELGPGERVRYDGDGLGKISTVDPIADSQWRRGIVEFRNTPLAEAVEEMNRYRLGRIILMNSSLERRLLSGRFRIDQMDKALLQLEEVFSAKLRRLPGGIILLS